MNGNMQIIIGTNIDLLPITKNDTENIIKWRNQPFVRENFIERSILTKEMHEEWLKNKVNTGLVKQFIIYVKDTQTAIGTTYLRDIDKKNENAEYGIFIGEEKYLGLGFGKEVTKLMLEFAGEGGVRTAQSTIESSGT